MFFQLGNYDNAISCVHDSGTIRTLFDRQLYQRKGILSSEDQLSLKTTMSSQNQNRDKTEYMAVFAMMGGRKVKLVEGIEGRRAGEAMVKTISDYLKP